MYGSRLATMMSCVFLSRSPSAETNSAAVMSCPRLCFACEPGKEGRDFAGAVELVIRRRLAAPDAHADTAFNGCECILVGYVVADEHHPRRLAETFFDVADNPASRFPFVPMHVRQKLEDELPAEPSHLAAGEKRRSAALDARFGVRSQRVGHTP